MSYGDGWYGGVYVSALYSLAFISNDINYVVNEVVSYIRKFMTLLPGDIISTGTSLGVGLGFNPPRFLRKVDVVELGIEALGSSK